MSTHHVTEALASRDDKIIRQVRGTEKGRVTRLVDKLSKIIQIPDAASKNQAEVRKTELSLEEAFKDVQKLHDGYQWYRIKGKDATEEEAFENEENDYIMKIEEKYSEGLASIEKYRLACEEIVLAKEMGKKEVALAEEIGKKGLQIKNAKRSFETAKKVVLDVLNSEDENVQRTASIVKIEFKKNYENLLVLSRDALELLRVKKGVTSMEKEEADCSKEEMAASEIINKLDVIIQLQEFNEKEKQSASLLERSAPMHNSTVNQTHNDSFLKLKKLSAPKFSGLCREFAKFKRDFNTIVVVDGRNDVEIGATLKESVPRKWHHLIDNLGLDKHKEMMKILTSKFGSSRVIVDEIVSEIKRMKQAPSDKMFVQFVDSIENIQRDLVELGLEQEIASTMMVSELEMKLPLLVKRDWTKHIMEEEGDKSPKVVFDAFMEFIKKTKRQVEYQCSETRQSISHGKSLTVSSFVTGTAATPTTIPGGGGGGAGGGGSYGRGGGGDRVRERTLFPCLACNSDGVTDLRSTQHPMDNCEVWNSLGIKEKEKKVKCLKHPFATNHTTAGCARSIGRCKLCSDNSHHFLLCPKRRTSAKTTLTKSMVSNSDLPPVMVQTAYVNTAYNNVILGAMFDLCSTDDYITHKMARKMGCEGVDVELVVEGIKGMEYTEQTKLYEVPVVDGAGNTHTYQCYGLDKISSTSPPPEKNSYRKLCDKFKVKPWEVEKPQDIDILISMRRNPHHPKPVKTLGDMTLYEGIFGKVFGGSDAKLQFTPYQTSYPALVREVDRNYTQTMRTAVKSATLVTSAKTEKEFLDYFKEDMIGVECNPKCGGCRCGQCAIGAKPMSLKDEREYERFKSNLSYEEKGTPDDPGPYWRTSYPWNIDKNDLVCNKSAVLGVMNATKRKLKKDPFWEEVYETQLKDLLRRGFAREVMDEELMEWKGEGGKCHYIAHQMALNPGSKSTPVRVVFNSSQVFRGHSLNNSWDLGPDVMSNLQGVLLRFRKDLVGGQGDMTKMFYMVRVTMEEEMVQLFVWQFKGEEKLRTFAMCRLVMGNKPSGNISIVAVKETAKLEDYQEKYPVAYQALTYDSYVDNVFLTAPDLTTLSAGIQEIEMVSAKGGFKYKEWIVSGKNVPEQIVTVKLPNAIDLEEEKALGVFWDVKNDEFYVKPGITEDENKLVDSKKIDRNTEKLPSLMMKPLLTLRIGLSFHAKTYDPLGLVLPTRMIGHLLFRKSLQRLKGEQKGRIPWDEELPEDLKKEWLDYFEMLIQLEKIRFRRSFKPDSCDPNIEPVLVTFTDGNPDGFGAVAYTLWTLLDGSRVATLVMSKAKLAPLLQKGETVRNELSGATFGCRLKAWIYEHSGIKFGGHVPFLDSQIVQAMVRKESYGFNCFAGLRVGEIQQKTDRFAWKHIPSKENISDILTRGAPPSVLGPDSIWQTGPRWLVQNVSAWPVTEVKEQTVLSEEMNQFCVKKPKNATIAQAYSSGVKNIKSMKSSLAGDWFDDLVASCGTLKKLIRCMAYVIRASLSARSNDQHGGGISGRGETLKTNLVKLKELVGRSIDIKDAIKNSNDITEISANEYSDAWKIIIFMEQERRLSEKDVIRLVPKTVEVKLSHYNSTVQHVVLGGRVSSFPEGFSSNANIPILPIGALAKLVVAHYHNKFHKQVDTIVTHVRRDVWVIKARKIASSIDVKCKICLERRKKWSGQVMGDLPSCRSSDNLPAWSAVNMDLFGPLTIRDDCVKRGPRIYKKVYGVLYTCTRTRGVYLDVAMDYSTEAVIHTVRRLMVHKGNVGLIISDPGSQLRGANKEISGWRKGWDQDKLVRFGADKGLEWRFVMPSSQHQNGAAEIMIKMVKGVKKSFMQAMGDTKMSLNELNTLMAEISNIVNERPIGIKPNIRTDPEYLSPNSLYLGRCSERISSGPFQPDEVFNNNPASVHTRFLLVQAITNQFWKVWHKIYFPTLIIRQKWHSEKRNMLVGDVCLLRDPDAFRAEWRLARVTATYPDSQGHVRNVEVRVMPSQDGSAKYKPVKANYLKRHVSNLVVIVPNEDHDNNEAEHMDAEDRTVEEVDENETEVIDRSLNKEVEDEDGSVEEVGENEGEVIDRSLNKKVEDEDGSKFDEEIEAIV